MTQKLYIDIDNVVAQTDEVMRKVIHAHTDGAVDLQYSDIKHFDYHRCKDSNNNSIDKLTWDLVHEEFSEEPVIRSIRPVSGVQRHLARLSEYFDIHLVTSRLTKARAATVAWLDDNNFDFDHGLHFVRHGEKHTIFGDVAAAIEDDIDQAIDFANRGVTSIVLAHPWNARPAKHANLSRVGDWQELTPRLLDLLPAEAL